MSKRVRITAIVATLCLCLSLFVIGVLSATTATLNVTSTLKFEADGVYVMVDAKLKQGATVTDADVIEGEGEPTGQSTYTAYSYKKATDSNAPDGSASSDTFLQADGTTPAGDWAIGDITYTSTNKVVVYEFTVSNYSPFEVTGTITTNLSDIISSSNGQLSVATYKDSVQDSSPTYSFNIPARTNETTPGTITYQIAVTLNNFMSGFTTEQINMEFQFEKFDIQANYDYFIIENYIIKGLTEQYTQDAPETLVVPGVAEDGTPLIIGTYNQNAGGGIVVPELSIDKEQSLSSTNIQNNSLSNVYSVSTYANEDQIVYVSDYVFKNLVSSKVIIKEGITSLPDYAFFGASSLESIEIPSSVTSIGMSAFYHRTSLTSINIPEGVTSIGGGAFTGCTSLKSITIPSSVKTMGNGVFVNCSSLESINISEGVTSIGGGTFRGCSSLTSITLPSSVTSIGEGVFNGCNLLQIIVASDNANYSSYYGSLYNKDKTEFIRVAGGVSTVEILDTVKSIGDNAFYGCTSLTSINIPEGVTSIGDGAFSGCSSLESITIPSSVKTMGNTIFANCSSLESIEIPSGTTSIGERAFYFCDSLTSITIPNSVTSIGYEAFRGCDNLKYNEYENGEYIGNSENPYIVLMDTVNTSFTEFNINVGCKFIDDTVFFNCSSLESIEIPNGVISIGDRAFDACTSLTSIKIPSSVTTIRDSAFSDCSSLTNIEIPSSVTSIGRETFLGCSSLESINIPSSVTSIGVRAFEGCSSLESITLPSSVTSIDAWAFDDCASLKYIQITGNLTESYSLPSGTWVKTDSEAMPTDWTNDVYRIPTTNSAGYYHQQSAWESAN